MESLFADAAEKANLAAMAVMDAASEVPLSLGNAAKTIFIA